MQIDLLSDGSLVRYHNTRNISFQIAQSVIHKEYISHVYSMYKAIGLYNNQALKYKQVLLKEKYTYYQFVTPVTPGLAFTEE